MNHLSLFSGIGGIDLAAEWAGMTTVAFCEQNKFCQKILAKHWPTTPIFDDIHTLTAAALRERGIDRIDIISGGFPCQPYSFAGKQLGNDDDRALWPQMLRVIAECKPRWVIGENVAGIINLALDGVLTSLEAEGYEARAVVLPACAVGAWHIRQRVFIVAYDDNSGQQNGQIQYHDWLRQSSTNTSHDGASKSVADTKSQPKRESANQGVPITDGGETRNELGNSGSHLQHAGSTRCEKLNAAPIASNAGHPAWRSDSLGSQWATEPAVGRVAHGVPRRVDRLRALGNAVVPQQVYPILNAIMEIEQL